ncbi:hypothetical protein [uncultured Phenylobacterium sp.]|uniref:hypothetical protein n=1 Tax=uncultured Phenylobacterium sp. TaxID=349273 RepID=UPI0025EFB161|nr:hypothetical protein [uncultured Phenylobacterium sp.]
MPRHVLAAALACLMPGLALAGEPTPPADPAAAPSEADKASKADKSTAMHEDRAANPADESASPASDTTAAATESAKDKPNYDWKAKPVESTTKAPDEPQ